MSDHADADPQQADVAAEIRERFGDIDIYLFDQLQKGRIKPGMCILDAGCGHGRNLVYFLRRGFDVHGTDADPAAIAAVRALAARLAPPLAPSHFRVCPVEALGGADARFDVVLCNAVLHFARDEAHFEGMLSELWRVLAPGGLLFTRLASSIGLVGARHLEGRRFLLPDGSERFLVDEAMLLTATAALRARLVDPLKTTVVQGQRSMTTWCLRKA